jgi:hypothetical protein
MLRVIVIVCLAIHSLYLCISGSLIERNVLPDKQPDAYEMIREAEGKLQDGDLVVRLNTDPVSQLIRNYNRVDKRYSHAGIVFFHKGKPYIYHVVNGNENPGEFLRRDSIQKFCDPAQQLHFGIYRYRLSKQEKEKIRGYVLQWYRRVSFDDQFDFTSDNKMYCSEMIAKALSRATQGRIIIGTTTPTRVQSMLFARFSKMPLEKVVRLKIVPIDQLYKNAWCTPVAEYKFRSSNE